MDDDAARVRTHGFQRPFHPLQVLSWVVFGGDVLCYLIFCLPLIETLGAKVAVAVLYVTSVIVLVIFTAKATSCDPADPHLHQHNHSDGSKSDDNDNLPYCTMCQVSVNSRSKHCRACNKCVDVFDHHCIWLNNCVGKANYHWFFGTVVSVAVMIGFVLMTCLYLFIDYFTNEEGFEQRLLDSSYEEIPKGFFLGVMITMVIVNTPLYLLDMQLVVLHLFLMSQNLTTYEYIINKTSPDYGREMSQQGRVRRKVVNLPSCLDWIVFCRWCQKRRRKQQRNNGVEQMDMETTVPPDTEEAPEGDEEEEAGGSDTDIQGRPHNECPSPPGSTIGVED